LTLLELVIAVLVLSLGALAAVRATDQSRLAIGGMEIRQLAQIVARNRVQELYLLGATGAASLPAEVQMGGRNFTVSVVPEATAGGLIRAEVTVRSAGGPGAFVVAYVLPFGPGAER
jgi:general secretion pathway protein I